MFTSVNTITIQGIETINVEVQICLAPGIPCFNIVGLPDKIVAESKERVRAAITAIGMKFPLKRIIVNLAPANIFKIGNHYDLPIALGIILLMLNDAFKYDLQNYIVMGELALNGDIKSVCSVLPAAIYANNNSKGIICPYRNGVEAKISRNKVALPVKDLNQLVNYLTGNSKQIEEINETFSVEEEDCLDMKDVKGQESAKRAMEIAAAGGHNILMEGPPGTGKSMLAKRITGILPALSRREILEINLIASITGAFKNLIYRSRPFRSPHHSCSINSMVGGGKFVSPGEVTLAHNGVLFLDELPEFPRNVIEALRQPIENREISISRVNAKVTYPANFQLIAAMNPCKCGYLGTNPEKTCRYAPKCGHDYRSKISGPIFDRFDIFAEVSNVDIFEERKRHCESSAQIKERVLKARSMQKERYKSPQINANLSTDLIDKFIKLDNDSIDLLKKAISKKHLSMRGYNKVLKVARTIADLDASNEVKRPHIAEALYYRLNH